MFLQRKFSLNCSSLEFTVKYLFAVVIFEDFKKKEHLEFPKYFCLFYKMFINVEYAFGLKADLQ